MQNARNSPSEMHNDCYCDAPATDCVTVLICHEKYKSKLVLHIIHGMNLLLFC